jgi:hypothetical protein
MIRLMGKRALDMTGQEFERLLVLARDPERSIKHRAAYWKCLCDPRLGGCGKTAYATGPMLRNGQHKSCGCLRREGIITRSTKHGEKTRSRGTPTWNSWMNMLRRCEKPNHPRYADWGGRGITVCRRWHDFASFLADMGEKPAGLTLDRKDNDGGYWCGHCAECRRLRRPANCHWTTHAKQQVNRRGFKLIPAVIQEIQGLADDGLTMSAIAGQMGLGRHTVAKALFRT